MSKEDAREIFYGMPYEDWKARHQSETTPERQAAFRTKPPPSGLTIAARPCREPHRHRRRPYVNLPRGIRTENVTGLTVFARQSAPGLPLCSGFRNERFRNLTGPPYFRLPETSKGALTPGPTSGPRRPSPLIGRRLSPTLLGGPLTPRRQTTIRGITGAGSRGGPRTAPDTARAAPDRDIPRRARSRPVPPAPVVPDPDLVIPDDLIGPRHRHIFGALADAVPQEAAPRSPGTGVRIRRPGSGSRPSRRRPAAAAYRAAAVQTPGPSRPLSRSGVRAPS